MAVSVFAVPATAQRGDSGAARASDTTRATPLDSLYARARRLVLEGNGDAGRALMDSLLGVATGTPAYADALYWRAALAATAAEAEKGYRRLIVEYPFSPHAGDALLALAQLEMARGDRVPAIDHLERFLLQRPEHPERVRAAMWLGRMHLERNERRKGCAVLLRTRATLGVEEAEIRNQLDYYAAPCAGVDTTRAVSRAAAASPAAAPTSAPTPIPAPVNAASSAVARAPNDKRYTVQVAAYDTRAAAQQLIERLAARGVTARLVDTGSPPFRVRVGTYATEAAATAVAADLKSKGVSVFVTTTDIERAAPPGRP
jgi:hypothetical protein